MTTKKKKKIEINPHGFGAPNTKKPHGEKFTKHQLESFLSDGEEGEEGEKRCPRCNKYKLITEFGLRRLKSKQKDGTIKEIVRPQSYCFSCRTAHGKKMAELKEGVNA